MCRDAVQFGRLCRLLEEPVVAVCGLEEQTSARYMPVFTGHNGIKMYGEVEV
jgi:hypothetical protein